MLFTISKDNSLVGKGEILISQKQILAKENLITKWINLEQNDNKKGKGLNNIMKINIKMSLAYYNINAPLITNNTNNLKCLPLAKSLALNKNYSGNINMTPSMRSNLSIKQRGSVLTPNHKNQMTATSKSKMTTSNILNLSQKYKTMAEDSKGILLKIKGKSQGKPAKILKNNYMGINNSINSAFNYNLSYTGIFAIIIR